MISSLDAITRYFASINDPLSISLSSFFDSYIVLIYLAFFVLFYRYLERKRLIKAVLSIFLALTITFLLKYGLQIPRPCMLYPELTKIECPTTPDYSFPSGHTAIASSFLAAFVGTPAFLVFLPLNLLVGFSRLNLGVHFLNDTIASFVIAFFAYDIVDRFTSRGTLSISKPRSSYNKKFEVRRQILHIVTGVLFIIGMFVAEYLYGQNGLIYFEFAIYLLLQIILIIIDDYLQNKSLGKVLSPLFKAFERTGAKPGYGAFWYGMGILFAFVFINEFNMIAATIVALAFGDGLATIFGVRGKIPNPINSNKTVEGSLAFFIGTAIIAYPFIGMVSLPFALVTALVEALPPKFDDNFMIPLVSILFSFFV